mgnify:FL=1
MCTCCMVNLCNINGFCYELLIKIQQTAYLLFKHGFACTLYM